MTNNDESTLEVTNIGVPDWFVEPTPTPGEPQNSGEFTIGKTLSRPAGAPEERPTVGSYQIGDVVLAIRLTDIRYVLAYPETEEYWSLRIGLYDAEDIEIHEIVDSPENQEEMERLDADFRASVSW